MIGAFIGSTLGVLFAPKAGKKLRKELKEQYEQLKKKVEAKVEELKPKTKKAYEEIVKKVVEEAERLKQIRPEDVASVTRKLQALWTGKTTVKRKGRKPKKA